MAQDGIKIRNNDRPEDMILVDVRDVQAASTPLALEFSFDLYPVVRSLSLESPT